jgi:hypothetical protein
MSWFALLLLAATPGEIRTPYPTISNLAIEWQIDGDDDLDATCAVRFRKSGDSDWRTGMPLRRVPAGSSRETTPVRTWTNRLSGSLFDLEPGTEYEIELQLIDPDGGEALRVVRAGTRPEPVASADAPVRAGGKEALNSVGPGEILELEDGDYGAVRFNRDGAPGRPVIYRSRTGRASFTEIGLSDRKWVYLEGLTVNGPVRMNGCEACVVRRCRIQSQYGIKAYRPGILNSCIEDNIITGIQPWKAEIMGAKGENAGEGIQITGSGNVIRYNRVSGFRDCLSHLEDDDAVEQSCNDWLNNEVSAGLDDGIEADFAGHNCRILRNRLTNCFVGISSHPGLGGPNYFVRNVMFNIAFVPFKLHRYSQGDVILHNTVVKQGDALGNYSSEPFDHALLLNNLFIGGKPTVSSFGGYSAGRGRAIDVQRFGDHCRFDFNLYAVAGLPFEGKFRTQTFHTLPGTEFEPHGRQTSLAVLLTPVEISDPLRSYPPADLRLNPQGDAIDAAERIPNLNDGFTGAAPDAGALESGVNSPAYGPRVVVP